ncbi:hypothetical protein BUALT_Bualt10G0063100 [Buddleja alternifolia]|uniref:Ovate family protein n=1 Tax=Buddleja alternifolia TaxID=168488 RepID=A0AAV6WX92_9LAMI|nr:hypothetical protein BUALT_Bualt10G0063100 [Buddleja alternifolia]
MEKTKPRSEQAKMANQSSDVPNHVIWDCESSLYDSFELKSFHKHLDSAIASRTLSMPHLSERRRLPSPPPPPLTRKTTSSKISRSFRRLIGAVFRHKKNSSKINSDSNFGGGFGETTERSNEGFYFVYDDSSAALSAIKEVPDSNEMSPEMRCLVRRTASDRFSTCIGISS